MDRSNIHIEEDGRSLARAAAELIAQRARAAIADHGRCTIALAGGSTPHAAYELLGQPPYRNAVLWESVHIFWGDERFVPRDHADSNQRMARSAWLDHVAIPAANIHTVRVELGDPYAAAAAYEQTIRNVFRLSPGQLPRFDVVLLGLGEDGHTASLFPGTATLEEQERLVAATYVEKLSAWRITMTAPLINAAACVAFLVAGSAKAQVLREVLHGPSDPQRLPAQLIRPTNGEYIWLLDRAAAGEL